MPDTIQDLVTRLAENAEAVCRHYLSNGRRQGRYWTVGDVRNTPGRSLFVRLSGPESGPGAAGHWTDAASAEHGDLLDVIRGSCGLVDFRDVAEEARRFLALPRAEPQPRPLPGRTAVPAGSLEAARRLIAMSQPIRSTLVETYLRRRGIKAIHDAGALRFHPRCFYRADPGSPDGAHPFWPAMVAAVTDASGGITGLQRTWLNPAGTGKAPVSTPRRAMGHLLGHAVRFGVVSDVMAAGEGIETMLSLRSVLPTMPMAAALSAGHLGAFLLPSGLRRLYVARDNDRAGRWATGRLVGQARQAGIEAIVLAPVSGDFNDDLCRLGPGALANLVRSQLAPEDVARFWRVSERQGEKRVAGSG